MNGSLSQEEAAAAGVDYRQDLETAKSLLAEAGYADGFTISLITSTDHLTHYTVLQEELAQIGITVELGWFSAVMHEQIRCRFERDHDLTTRSATSDTYPLTQFFTEGGSVTNFSHACNSMMTLRQRRNRWRCADQGIGSRSTSRSCNQYASFGLMFTNQVYVRSDAVDYSHELVFQCRSSAPQATTKRRPSTADFQRHRRAVPRSPVFRSSTLLSLNSRLRRQAFIRFAERSG
ncbi:MAG: hypothetical protein R2845_06525 [Thermomicrobiales bacterium]